MREPDWITWVGEHSALLGMNGPIAAELFRSWKPLLANCTLDELRDASRWIAEDITRVSKPWATHYAQIRQRLHATRQAQHAAECQEKLPPADENVGLGGAGFSWVEEFERRTGKRIGQRPPIEPRRNELRIVPIGKKIA